MTEAQKHLRNQLLTKIHTQSEYKNIVKFGGKEAWSEWVYVRFGVVSCKELSISELNLVNGLLQGFYTKKAKERLACGTAWHISLIQKDERS